MTGNDPFTDLVLGTGGERPGAYRVSPDGATATPLLVLSPGHSVYALNVDAEHGRVAAGTRLGTIIILSSGQCDEPGQCDATVSLCQGAPILSLCFLNDLLLAGSDTAGRCLLWDLSDRSRRPTSLMTSGNTICSLRGLPDGRLVGLASQGGLLWWDLTSGQLTHTVDGPAPPGMLAFVRLCLWPAHDAIVYPAQGGSLASCALDQSDMRVRAAHDGDFYAMTLSGDRLSTIGTHDGLLKTWRDLDGQASGQVPLAQGIVSTEALTAEPRCLLLINEHGEAATYAVGADAARLLHRFDGNTHRAVAGPPPEVREALERRQRLARAKEIESQIRSRIEAGQLDATEELHGQLTALGFPAVSLGLRAEEARRRSDIVGELGARRRLAEVLDPDDARSHGSLRRYAALLATTWQLDEARRVLSTIPAAEDEGDLRSWLAETAGALKGEGVIEPDQPMPTLIEAATVLGRPFVGRWLLEASPPLLVRRGDLAGDLVVRKYEQVKAEDGRPELPGASLQTLRWLSRDAVRHTETVVLDCPQGPAIARPQLAIQVTPDSFQSAIVQSIVLHIGKPAPDCSAEGHNRQVLAAYERAHKDFLASPWFQEVNCIVRLAIRRLLTEAKSRWST